MTTPDTTPSARPQVTARMMAQTGLDEDVLHALVHRFYDKVRVDPLLGPIFDARIADWGPHLDRMVAFWSSVALMTGRYHGRRCRPTRPCPSSPGTSTAGWRCSAKPRTRSALPPGRPMSSSAPNASRSRCRSR